MSSIPCATTYVKYQAHEAKSEEMEHSRCASLVAEYLERTARLAPLFPRLRPLPDNIHCRLAYETPQNLALELSKSILYENADSIDIKTLNSHEDSLWNGKPQQYFESMNAQDSVADVKDFEDDSLA
ncbi:unnamed protein product, partial [Brenthis ino]